MIFLSKESMIYIIMTLYREIMIPAFKQISPPKKPLYEILKVSITLTHNEFTVTNIFSSFPLR